MENFAKSELEMSGISFTSYVLLVRMDIFKHSAWLKPLGLGLVVLSKSFYIYLFIYYQSNSVK